MSTSVRASKQLFNHLNGCAVSGRTVHYNIMHCSRLTFNTTTKHLVSKFNRKLTQPCHHLQEKESWHKKINKPQTFTV